MKSVVWTARVGALLVVVGVVLGLVAAFVGPPRPLDGRTVLAVVVIVAGAAVWAAAVKARAAVAASRSIAPMDEW